MGILLSLRHNPGPISEEVIVDFENSKPSEAESESFTTIQKLLDEAPGILNSIRNYKGCNDHIREAIKKPSEETEIAAWQEIVPSVLLLKGMYEYSVRLKDKIELALTELCFEDPSQNIRAKQSIAKQFAEILQFVLLFDSQKMLKPAIQNDFSYYRRNGNKMKKMKPNMENILPIQDDLATKMSLFYANATPMMRAVVDITTMFAVNNTKGIPADNITDCLSLMVSICSDIITKGRFSNTNTIEFCLRVLTACIVLYDQVHSIGAFSKNSPIKIKTTILLIKQHSPEPHLIFELLQTLKHNTRNIKDAPPDIKAMLETKNEAESSEAKNPIK